MRLPIPARRPARRAGVAAEGPAGLIRWLPRRLAAARPADQARAAPAPGEGHDAKVEVFLSDYGREFCGRPDQHTYELFFQLEAIEHRTTRVRRPQSNGIVERLHRTLLDERFHVEGRRTWFETIEEMQAVLDIYLDGYNQRRPHHGRGMNGRTPAQAFKEGLPKPQPTKGEKTPSAKAA